MTASESRQCLTLPPPNAAHSIRLLRSNPTITIDIATQSLLIRRRIQKEFILDHPEYDRSVFLFWQGNPLRTFCQACVPCLYQTRLFGRPPGRRRHILQMVVFAAVLASIVIAAIATPTYRQQYYKENGFVRSSWFELAQMTISAVFLLEAAIKIVADGFFFTPTGYLKSLWNAVDFFVMWTVLHTTIAEVALSEGVNRFTRALVAMRCLRLITMTHYMRDTFHTVLYGSVLGELFRACLIIAAYLIPWAIWKVNLFAGRLYSCSDPEISGKPECTGEYLAMPVDDSLPFLVPRTWTNPDPLGSEWSYDNFASAILISWEIVSIEGWTDVLASVLNINGIDNNPQMNASQWNGIALVVFMLLGSILMGSLFIRSVSFSLKVISSHAKSTSLQCSHHGVFKAQWYL
jgi:hypothetical protein